MRREVSSMPGVFNLSIDEAVKEVEDCAALGLGGLLLFGMPDEKDEDGTGAWAAGRHRRSEACVPSRPPGQLQALVIIADVCLCEYTSHGHCGVVAQDARRALTTSRQRPQR